MSDERDQLTEAVIGAAIAVHRELGPGLLESTYEACLAYELLERDIPAARQVPMPVVYRGHPLDCGYRIDLLVSGLLIVEVKSVETVQPLHHAQVMTYLKLSQLRVGLLLNFNARLLRDGIKRFVVG